MNHAQWETMMTKLLKSPYMPAIRFGVSAIMACYSLNVLLRGEIQAFLIGLLMFPAFLCIANALLWHQKRRQDASMPENEGMG